MVFYPRLTERDMLEHLVLFFSSKSGVDSLLFILSLSDVVFESNYPKNSPNNETSEPSSFDLLIPKCTTTALYI